MPKAGEIDSQIAESLRTRRFAENELVFFSISVLAVILAENHSNGVLAALSRLSRLSGTGQLVAAVLSVSVVG